MKRCHDWSIVCDDEKVKGFECIYSTLHGGRTQKIFNERHENEDTLFVF